MHGILLRELDSELLLELAWLQGVLLQGCFHVSEPVSAVLQWVREALREPAVQFALIKPDKKPLTANGRVGDCDLAPAILLNFRPLTELQHRFIDSSRSLSFLNDALLVRLQTHQEH